MASARDRCSKRSDLCNVRMPGEWVDEYPHRLSPGERAVYGYQWAFRNPAGLPEAVHMVLAAYCAAGFATAGIHALLAASRPFKPIPPMREVFCSCLSRRVLPRATDVRPTKVNATKPTAWNP